MCRLPKQPDLPCKIGLFVLVRGYGTKDRGVFIVRRLANTTFLLARRKDLFVWVSPHEYTEPPIGAVSGLFPGGTRSLSGAPKGATAPVILRNIA